MTAQPIPAQPMFDDEDLPNWLVAAGITYGGQIDPIAGLPTPPWKRTLKYQMPAFPSEELPTPPWRKPSEIALPELPLTEKPLPPWANQAMVQASAFPPEIDLDTAFAAMEGAAEGEMPADPFGDLDWLAGGAAKPGQAGQPAPSGGEAWLDDIDLFAADRPAGVAAPSDSAAFPAPTDQADALDWMTDIDLDTPAAPETALAADFSLFDSGPSDALPDDPFADVAPALPESTFAAPNLPAESAPPVPAELDWLADFTPASPGQPELPAAADLDFFRMAGEPAAEEMPMPSGTDTGPLNLDAFVAELPDNTAEPLAAAPDEDFDLFADMPDLAAPATESPAIVPPVVPPITPTNGEIPDWLQTGPLGTTPAALPPEPTSRPNLEFLADLDLPTTPEAPPVVPATSEIPDWLHTGPLGATPPPPAGITAPAAPADDFDFFAELGGLDLPTPDAVEADLPSAAPATDIPDWLHTGPLGEPPASVGASAQVPDWFGAGDDLFAEAGAPAAETGSPAWLEESAILAKPDSKPKAATPPPAPTPDVTDIPDWLHTGFLAEPTPPPTATPKPPVPSPKGLDATGPATRKVPPPSDLNLGLGDDDLDSLLGDIGGSPIAPKLTTEEMQAILPGTPLDLDTDLDFDALFPGGAAAVPPPPAPKGGPMPPFPVDFGNAPDLSGTPPPAPQPRATGEFAAQLGAEVLPEWVSDLKPTAGPVMIRIGDQEIPMDEQPLATVPDSVKQLRERLLLLNLGKREPTAPAPSSADSLIANIKETLPPAPPDMAIEAPAPLLSGVIVSDMQAKRVNALRGILRAQEDLLRRAQAGEASPLAAKRRRISVRFDRIALSILLVVTVILPFFASGGLLPPLPTLDGLPPADQLRFGAVIGALEGVPSGESVLVAIEYTPLAAGELDMMARAVLRKLMDRGVRPVLLSTNPAGALHAYNLAVKAAGTNRQPGKDYIVLGLLPGTVGGVRALASTDSPLWQAALFGTDIEGRPTGLDRDAVSILLGLPAFVFAQSSDDVRAWAEQYRASDGTGRPIALLVAAGAGASATAYASAEPTRFGGPLIGLRDGLIFSAATGYPAPRDEGRWGSLSLAATMAAMMILIGAAFGAVRSRRKGRSR